MTDRDTTFPGDGRASTTYGSMRPEPGQTSASSKPPMVELSQKAKDDVAEVKDIARDKISQATTKAEELADSQKGYAAERVAGLAQAMEKVGAELEQGENREVGRMARQMGESVHRFADDIKGRSMGEIAGMAEDFGRRQPLAFLGLAAMAGLAASRFVTASASRQAGSSQTTSTGDLHARHSVAESAMRQAPATSAPASPPSSTSSAGSSIPRTTGASNV
ncbi:nutrient deprivation-induced protein [Rhizobium lemnae]|uniref:Nutrient deprivation-induced protein n=1 Tax=Rhizobium lemnae TaxID=1214924 RepID=A0ABV8E8J8_9HYPH|nr:nutrient deprivation-induced protein [Rhizobium lemnae]MCJ8507728.1 nutrient deprivation-induced protein [Rhizobium lemnae]